MIVNHVAVGIPTYHRPTFLKQLLDSLASADFPKSSRVTLIIVDNDAEGSARETLRESRICDLVEVAYRIEPNRGIAYVRNQIVKTAVELGAQALAFVDDDQLVDPNWLTALCKASEAYSADIVAGRCLPLYDSNVPEWVRRSGFWDQPPRPTGQQARYFGTNNVLVAMSALLAIPGPFDTQRNFNGGTDGILFERLHEAGFHAVWCAESIVYEHVQASRSTLSWLLRRQYRYGIDIAHRFATSSPSHIDTIQFLLRAIVSCSIHFACATMRLPKDRAIAAFEMGKSANAIGRIARLFGVNYAEYRRSQHGH